MTTTTPLPNRNVTIATTNTTSLTTDRMKKLPLYLLTNNIDILLLQETKIDSQDLEYLRFQLPHLHIYGSIGTNRSRGVLTLVRKDLFSAEEIAKNSNNNYQSLFEDGRVSCVQLQSKSLKFILINVYAPVEKDGRRSFFENLLSFMATLPGPFILAGD